MRTILNVELNTCKYSDWNIFNIKAASGGNSDLWTAKHQHMFSCNVDKFSIILISTDNLIITVQCFCSGHQIKFNTFLTTHRTSRTGQRRKTRMDYKVWLFIESTNWLMFLFFNYSTVLFVEFTLGHFFFTTFSIVVQLPSMRLCTSCKDVSH